MEKLGANGKRGWRWKDEVLFADTPEGKRAKWEYIKSLPEMEAVVLEVFKRFGKLKDIKVYKGG
tara:strand:+ start:207 stop:398 length:192 start_codon:yes stop_codon:yes gene_type:complete